MMSETYEKANGTGFYRLVVETAMVQSLVELAAGRTGIILLTKQDRDCWLDHEASEAMKRKIRGFSEVR